jgi:hypothetical protein
MRMDDQKILENIADMAKPCFSHLAVGFHFMLASLFRHRPRLSKGLLFRDQDESGVSYVLTREQSYPEIRCSAR